MVQVEEIVIDYSKCAENAPLAPATAEISDNVQSSFKSSKPTSTPTWQKRAGNDSTTICSLYFDIPHNIGPPVFMYYRLTNFYQNHRRYVQSLHLPQLQGEAVPNKTISGSPCDPLTLDPSGKAYYPCGLIANSLFNDTIHSPKWVNHGIYHMTNKGIAWESDKQRIKNTKYKPWQVVPPPNWQKRYPNNYTEENMPQLHDDEEFMVWMRTAGLPAFSKLSRRNDTAHMPAGTYILDIEHRKSRLLHTYSVRLNRYQISQSLSMVAPSQSLYLLGA